MSSTKAFERRLFVTWQHPVSRTVAPVGSLLQRSTSARTEYLFAYLKRAEHVDGFEPFLAFPDLYRVYRSEDLFPFFQNRLMSRGRPDYEEFVSSLSLPAGAEPFDVLSRSTARRTTDQIEVFAEPQHDPDTQRATCFFFVRGIRHVDGAEDGARSLAIGTRLHLLRDIQNHVNRLALLLATEKRRCIGYAPDYLVSFVDDMLSQCGPDDVRVEVEHINDFTMPTSRWVLCRMSSCWPPRYDAFSDPDYQPIVPIS